MSRLRIALLAAAALFVGVVVLIAVFGEPLRVPASVCIRCGVTQYDVYRVVTVFGMSLRLPNGTAATGAGNGSCPHQIRQLGR